ncbi:hypothetical protein MMC26_003410 [Xylographa opegraphella]|nr:hypothetical protein [Xylographa opegraphella]
MDQLTFSGKKRQLVNLVPDIPYYERFAQTSMVSKKVPSKDGVPFVEVQAINVLYDDSITNKLANVLPEAAVEVKQHFVPINAPKDFLILRVMVDGYAEEVKIPEVRVRKEFEALQSLIAVYVRETDE